ncbi:MAG: hypothetical protein RQ936_05065 [Gammaproteobacteria bacterium]|nr:hypothetical protein [Gammaproteobacteria bacterium]
MYSLNRCLGFLSSVAWVVAISQPTYANDDFAVWKQQHQDSFQEYKDKRDREFTAFLKTQWKEMNLLKGVELDPEPKPAVMPVAVIPPESPEPVITAPTLPVVKPEAVKEIPLPAPVASPAPEAQRKGRRLVINYLGIRQTFYYDAKFKAGLSPRMDGKAISDFWSALSLADYEHLIGQVNEISSAMRLNDWAHALLVYEISTALYPASESSRSLFTWFMLAKDGYQSRIAYNNREAFLLIPSQQPLYAVPYFTFEQRRYYALSFDGREKKLGQVYTYDGNYPGADKALNMQMSNEVLMAGTSAYRDLSFEFEGRRYAIRTAYENERIRFMETYPQLGLEWYFKTRVNARASMPLQQQLSDYMKDMDEQTAVNFLLRFVQTSLRYKTDEDQFGRENYLLPEETLYYPYSDCEDRSILFAWLVRSLLGMEVIVLDYPGHVATAVLFKGSIPGDSIAHNGHRYIVADPTYINASAGMTMPAFKNKKAEVIEIR